jgi:hypothetical protein
MRNAVDLMGVTVDRLSNGAVDFGVLDRVEGANDNFSVFLGV